MVLKLASDEVQEVRRALLAAYAQLVRELSRADGYSNRKEGLELCQRKWKLEALLQQLEHVDGRAAVLELVPAGAAPGPCIDGGVDAARVGACATF